MINGIREYMLSNLRKASDRDRFRARKWVTERRLARSQSENLSNERHRHTLDMVAAAHKVKAAVTAFKSKSDSPGSQDRIPSGRTTGPSSIIDLHWAMEKRFAFMDGKFDKLSESMVKLNKKLHASSTSKDKVQ